MFEFIRLFSARALDFFFVKCELCFVCWNIWFFARGRNVCFMFSMILCITFPSPNYLTPPRKYKDLRPEWACLKKLGYTAEMGRKFVKFPTFKKHHLMIMKNIFIAKKKNTHQNKTFPKCSVQSRIHPPFHNQNSGMYTPDVRECKTEQKQNINYVRKGTGNISKVISLICFGGIKVQFRGRSGKSEWKFK